MSAHKGSDHAHDLGHTVSEKVFLKVLIFLVIMTVITVAVSKVDFGAMNIVIAIVIASIKAIAVGLFFMHLKWENPLIWIYVVFPVILIVVMIGGIFTDNPYRGMPLVQQQARTEHHGH